MFTGFSNEINVHLYAVEKTQLKIDLSYSDIPKQDDSSQQRKQQIKSNETAFQ